MSSIVITIDPSKEVRMTRDQQKAQIDQLCSQIANELCNLVDADQIPQEWDATEFAWLIDLHGRRASRVVEDPGRYNRFHLHAITNDI